MGKSCGCIPFFVQSSLGEATAILKALSGHPFDKFIRSVRQQQRSSKATKSAFGICMSAYTTDSSTAVLKQRVVKVNFPSGRSRLNTRGCLEMRMRWQCLALTTVDRRLQHNHSAHETFPHHYPNFGTLFTCVLVKDARPVQSTALNYSSACFMSSFNIATNVPPEVLF